VRGAYNHDLAYSRQHQHRERVINHGLVVHRKQLLRNDLCDRVQTRSGTAGEDYGFHRVEVEVKVKVEVKVEVEGRGETLGFCLFRDIGCDILQ